MAIDIKDTKLKGGRSMGRYLSVAVAIAVAFFVAYGFASAAKTDPTAAFAGNSASGTFADGTSGGSAAGGCGGGCCGGGSSTPIPGEAKLEGDVQKVTIDTSSGGYSPNEITLKAGVPTEITITQSSGCLAQIVFPDAGITEDLTQGPKTITLPAMQAGEYKWSCGMQMAFGKLIVE